jgi:hypothetical protein
MPDALLFVFCGLIVLRRLVEVVSCFPMITRGVVVMLPGF